MPSAAPSLGPRDLAWLEQRGIRREQAEWQLEVLSGPARPVRLLRPATAGDGIERLSPERARALSRRAVEARMEGMLSKFVPASGAASRMFAPLIALLERPGVWTWERLETEASRGGTESRFVLELLRSLERTALGVRIAELAGQPDVLPVQPLGHGVSLDRTLALLAELAALPKALLPFHAYGAAIRTAFEEQIREGLGYLEDRQGVARYHFTVPADSRERFEREVELVRSRLPEGARVAVELSVQDSSTATLALDLATGAPARDAAGRPLLRPGGHGALLPNLEAALSPIVLVKNIDNVLPERAHPEVAFWQLVLVGRLLELLEELGPDRRAPVRVVGVVPNRGEPGGGPFWVEKQGRVSLQIVERVEVDGDDPAQRAILEAATHFNPVQLACALRDGRGDPISLAAWSDPEQVLLTEKLEGGRRLRILERPGLWNGGMAAWVTALVEIPGALFAPVKTALDLARAEHRVGGS